MRRRHAPRFRDCDWVLASDAEAAIAAAELEGFNRGWNHGSDAGAQAMLARCIEAVEDMPHDAYCAVPNAVYPIPVDCTCRLGRVLAALRGLGGSDE